MLVGPAVPVRQPVLRLAAATPERLLVARAVLAEGAAAAGGWVEEGAGEVRLVGAEPRRARRLRDLLDRLIGGATLVDPPGPAPDLAGLDAWLDRCDPLAVARRCQGWRLTPGGAVPAFLRLEIAQDALAEALGPLGADPDLLDHARRRMQLVLLTALADPAGRRALIGEGKVGRLHLGLPALPQARLPGLVATLPLAEAADPVALAARRAALGACGCALELEGIGAEGLALLDPAALPADLLRIAWSPALPAAAAGLDPARVVLAGAGSPEAERWARDRGIALVEASRAPGE